MELRKPINAATVQAHASQSQVASRGWLHLRLIKQLFAMVFQQSRSQQQKPLLPLATECAVEAEAPKSHANSHSLVRLQPVSPYTLPLAVQEAVWRAAASPEAEAPVSHANNHSLVRLQPVAPCTLPPPVQAALWRSAAGATPVLPCS